MRRVSGRSAIATCAGGSTRIPAAGNGVVGFKQSLGLIPHDMAPESFGNMSYITPMTRTVLDTALMLGGHGRARSDGRARDGMSGQGCVDCRQAARRT